MEYSNSLGLFKLIDISSFLGTNLALNISHFPLTFTSFELLNAIILLSIKRKQFHSLLILGKSLIPKILARSKKHVESQEFGIILLKYFLIGYRIDSNFFIDNFEQISEMLDQGCFNLKSFCVLLIAAM